jgi:hypothetical protein
LRLQDVKAASELEELRARPITGRLHCGFPKALAWFEDAALARPITGRPHCGDQDGNLIGIIDPWPGRSFVGSADYPNVASAAPTSSHPADHRPAPLRHLDHVSDLERDLLVARPITGRLHCGSFQVCAYLPVKPTRPADLRPAPLRHELQPVASVPARARPADRRPTPLRHRRGMARGLRPATLTRPITDRLHCCYAPRSDWDCVDNGVSGTDR